MTSRTFDLLISAWTFCDVEDREVFIEYLRVCGVIPTNTERPAIPAAPDGEPSIPTVDARGAGRGDAAPDVFPQSTDAVTNPEAPKSRPVDPATAASSRERPATAKTSAKEPSEAEGSGGVQDEEAIHPATNSNPQPPSSRAADRPAPTSSPVPAALSKPLRPHCLRPDACASGTREHCYQCRKQMAESEVAA